MGLPELTLIIMGPVMVLVLVLGWRFFLAADQRELKEHEQVMRAKAEQDAAANQPK